MVITAHYIDDDWVLRNCILRFVYMPAPNTADVLCDKLLETLMDWNIDRNLSTLTVDNCSTNDSMIGKMKNKIDRDALILGGELFHMRCAAHILNLIVKEGFSKFQNEIENVRDSVVYWTSSAKKIEKFEETARQLNIMSHKKLVLDCKTRWNSTYLMLSTALEYKNVFSRLKQRDYQYTCLPSEEDWNIASELCDRLENFYNVTVIFSGLKYPTANLFFIEVVEIKLSLYDWMTSTIPKIRDMSFAMIEKFDKYWDEIHGILSIATVLDPRYKMKSFECYFPLIYGEDRATSEIEKVHTTMTNLVKEYELKDKSKTREKNFSGSSMLPLSSRPPLKKSRFEAFLKSQDDVDNVRTDLDFYLEESLIPNVEYFDVLTWWKTNGLKFPILQKIAKDIFAIPMSTVASESAFSTSGRVVNPHRSRLLPSTLEAVMCAQSWLWTQFEDASKSSDGVYLYYWDDGDVSDIEESGAFIPSSME